MLLLTAITIAGITPIILMASADPAVITTVPTTATTAVASTITVTTGMIIHGPARSIMAITTGPIAPTIPETTIIRPAMAVAPTSVATAITHAQVQEPLPETAQGQDAPTTPAIIPVAIPAAIPAMAVPARAAVTPILVIPQER